MANSDAEERQRRCPLVAVATNSKLETHLLTAAVAIMTALLGWIALSTHQTAVDVAALNVKVENITANSERIDRMENRLHELESRAWH